VLFEKGDLQATLAKNDEIIGRLHQSVAVNLHKRVARALVNKGVTLGTLVRSEEAIAAYDEVLSRFGTAGEAALRERVARALFNKGFPLATLGRTQEAVAVLDELISRFGASDVPPIKECVEAAKKRRAELTKSGSEGQK